MGEIKVFAFFKPKRKSKYTGSVDWDEPVFDIYHGQKARVLATDVYGWASVVVELHGHLYRYYLDGTPENEDTPRLRNKRKEK